MSDESQSKIGPSEGGYPPALASALEHSASPVLHFLGSPDLLATQLLALFCSRQCPARLIVKAQDWARSVRDQDTTIISGFQTPVEQECLRVLLKGSCNLVICPARALTKRVPGDWRGAIEEGRLLVVSFFGDQQVRATVALAQERNRFVAALAGSLFIVHAPAGSRTLALAQLELSVAKPIVTLPDPANDALLRLGAAPIATKT